MMDLKQFAEAVKDEITKRLGEEYDVEVHEQLKNNGIVATQLYFRKQDCRLGSCMYLEGFFKMYREGQDLQTVTDIILSYYHSMGNTPIDFEKLTEDMSYKNWKDKIVFKLINTRDNLKLLKEIPSIPYLDLSIVFYIYFCKVDDMQVTALINNQNMETWGITASELYRDTLTNMQKDFPPVLNALENFMLSSNPENLLERETAYEANEDSIAEINMFVLSNSMDLFGATAMLYPGVMKQCKERIGSDFIILPSSVNEVILTPLPDDRELFMDKYEWSHIVQMVNEEAVLDEERLSNHVYRYCSAEDQIVNV